jgi:hypothetical protein
MKAKLSKVCPELYQYRGKYKSIRLFVALPQPYNSANPVPGSGGSEARGLVHDTAVRAELKGTELHIHNPNRQYRRAYAMVPSVTDFQKATFSAQGRRIDALDKERERRAKAFVKRWAQKNDTVLPMADGGIDFKHIEVSALMKVPKSARKALTRVGLGFLRPGGKFLFDGLPEGTDRVRVALHAGDPGETMVDRAYADYARVVVPD